MLRQIAVIFLLTAFMGQTFNKSLLFMSYYANPAALGLVDLESDEWKHGVLCDGGH